MLVKLFCFKSSNEDDVCISGVFQYPSSEVAISEVRRITLASPQLIGEHKNSLLCEVGIYDDDSYLNVPTFYPEPLVLCSVIPNDY